MATSTYLVTPKIVINSVNVSDQAVSVELANVFEALESTSFASTSRSFVAGLGNPVLTMSLYNSFAASETYATLKALVGTQTTVTVTPTTSTVSATNPAFTITSAYLESLKVINGNYGELDIIDLTFMGGTYSVAVS